MTNYQNRRRWAIDQQEKARAAYDADQPRRDAEREVLDDIARLNARLLDPETAKDATIVYLCEQVAALSMKLAEIRSAVNRK